MILNQHYLACLSHASYLIVDERTRTAAVVDPRRDVEEYLEEADRLGATIEYVLLTHFHADFVSGHLELEERTGARIVLGSRAVAEYDFLRLADGDSIEFGDVCITLLETPGHTPESVCYLVFDEAVSRDRPYAVLTGDTLFVGDVGRPDLMASVGCSAEELASDLYDSLHQKLLTLPDETRVYPAHGAGSMCGKNLGPETHTTIGHQRLTNYALQPMTKQQFVAVVTADQPAAPLYFGYDAALNRQQRSTLERTLALTLSPMGLDEALRARDAGAVVLDSRAPADFATAHLAGSVNVGLNGSFATWAGTLLTPHAPLVVIADPGRERETLVRLGRIGFDRVLGYLEGGMEAVAERPELLARIDRITCALLKSQRDRGAKLRVLDVRTTPEFQAGAIEGAMHLPLSELPQRIGEVPRDLPLVLVCKSGYRSTVAASLLSARPGSTLQNLVGGMDAWTAAALPVERESASGDDARR